MTDKEFINKFDSFNVFSADEILSICSGFIQTAVKPLALAQQLDFC